MNTNRDFLVIVDCKNGTVVEKRPIRFFNTDRNVSNLFIKLVIPIYVENDVVEYAELENASDYEVTLNVIAPNNELKTIKSTLLSEGLIFTIDFPISFTDAVGVYLCEFIISTMVNGIEEILTTEPFNYNVQGSISSNLGDKIEIEENLVQQLLEQIARLEEKVVTDDRDLTKFAKLTDLQTKVDREIGKSLISDTEIERLAQVDNYDDSGLRALINTKANQSDIPTKVSQLENDSNYATKSEIPTKVSQLENDKNYAIKSEIPTKVSQLQNDSDYVVRSEIPTKVSQLENDKNYTTQSYVINKINEAKLEGSEGIDLSIYVTLDDLVNRDYVSNSELSAKGYITETEVSSVYAKKTELHSHSNKAILDSITQEKINNWESKTSFSGNYNDLTNKPTIPTKTSQLTNDSGYLTEVPSEYAKLTDLNDYATEVFVNEAIANAKFNSDNIDLSKYAPIDNPNFTTAISMGRKEGSAVGSNSVALGVNNSAEGNCSFALGVDNSVGVFFHPAFALGESNRVYGACAFAVGYDNSAGGNYSMSQGKKSYAVGICSQAEGGKSESYGIFSHAEGLFTISKGLGQHVQGRCNIPDTDYRYAHIVGNGGYDINRVGEDLKTGLDKLVLSHPSDSGADVCEYIKTTESNAYTLDWNGNGWFAGEVYVGGTSQDDGKKLLSTADIYFDTDGNLCVTIGEVTKKFAPI